MGAAGKGAPHWRAGRVSPKDGLNELELSASGFKQSTGYSSQKPSVRN